MVELKSCGFLIVRGNPMTEFLLMVHPNRLDLPKGHVDANESEMECALRELEEETGIYSDDISIDSEFRFELRYNVRSKRTNFEAREKTLVIFLATLNRDVEIQITEHAGFQWRAWNPPHTIQEQTIDPLLSHLAKYLKQSK